MDVDSLSLSLSLSHTHTHTHISFSLKLDALKLSVDDVSLGLMQTSCVIRGVSSSVTDWLLAMQDGPVALLNFLLCLHMTDSENLVG